MSVRRRLVLTYFAALLASLLVMALFWGMSTFSERQERSFQTVMAQADELAKLRAQMEDGLVDRSVYRERLAAYTQDTAVLLWLIDGYGNIVPADLLPFADPVDGTIWSLSKEHILRWTLKNSNGFAPLTPAETKEYILPVLMGESKRMTGYFAGRLSSVSFSVIVPIVHSDQSCDQVLVFHKQMDALEQNDLLIIWRQAGFSVLGAAVVGLVLILLLSRYQARPIIGLLDAAKHKTPGIIKLHRHDEIAQLQKILVETTAQNEDLEELRRDFLANVSHELRSPLTNIQGYLQGLLDGAIDPKDREHYTAIALDEAKRMSLIIGDLLRLSRLASDNIALTLEYFDVNELLRRSLIAHSVAMEKKEIRVLLAFRTEKIFVYADAQLIRQVAENLLANAIKFLQEGGAITLRTHVAQNRAYITIADDGPGIAAEDLPYVFERFYKADKSHAMVGSGLGLSIVRSILDKHHQAIRISSKEGKGTIVTFTLETQDSTQKIQ